MRIPDLKVLAAVLFCAVAYCMPALADDAPAAAPKIIGGTPVQAGERTYQVGLLHADTADNFQAQFCGGTLINDNWVVTAAHCTEGETAATIQVLTGTNKLNGSGTRHAVASISVHPRYCGSRCGFDYDVAVLRLATPAEKGLDHAALITPSQEDRYASPGDDAVTTGWGSLDDSDNPPFPITLQKVTLPLVARTACNAKKSYDGTITSRMVCAGFAKGGKDSCQGDSGGPLVVSAGSKWILAGITSFGYGCARPDLYGVYSRVAVLRTWILAQIRK